MPSPPSPERHSLSWLTDAGYNTMPLWYPLHFLTTQFTTLPLPSTSYASQTILITGANSGLGLEAARHFVRLNAAKVILAVRDTEKGRVAQADIEASTSSRKGSVCEVWQVDFASASSVLEFCDRVEKELDRLDVVVANAGVAIGTFEECEGGWERTVMVNVVGAFLMGIRLLPLLRRTAGRFNVEPRFTVVSSDAHMFAKFKERHEPRILDAFKDKTKMNEDRYNTSKLLQVLLARELAARLPPNSPIIVNSLNPGFCRTDFFRHAAFPLNYLLKAGVALIGRSSEMGSRTILAATGLGRESHGRYMDCCVLRDPSALVVSEEGAELQRKVWGEFMEELEAIRPGTTAFVSGG